MRRAGAAARRFGDRLAASLAARIALALVPFLMGPAACAPAGPSIPAPPLADVEPDIVRAIEEARAEVAAAPDSAEAWGALGDRYMAHQFLASAAECYRRAEELDPTSSTWPYRRGWAVFGESTEEALDAFERALADLGDYPPAHEAYARALFRDGRDEEAAEHFRRACELDPEAAHPHTGLGQVALARGDFDAARGHFEDALARDPNQAEAHVGIAQAYTALGNTEQARHHAEVSRTLPPTSERRDVLATPMVSAAGARARAVQGRAYEKAKRFDEAFEEYRIAVESDPHYYVARKRYAMLLHRRGRSEEAEALLEEGLRLAPGSPEIAEDLAKVRGE